MEVPEMPINDAYATDSRAREVRNNEHTSLLEESHVDTTGLVMMSILRFSS